MASNIAVKITADAAGLQAGFAVARAESSAFTSDLNKLARQAAQMGPPTQNFQKNLLDAAQAAVTAKAKVADLKDQMANSQGSTVSFSSALGLLKGGLASLGLGVSIGMLKQFAEAVEEGAAHLEHEAEVLQLTVTAYQAFRNAAMDSGVETEVADNAVRKFSIGVGQAQVGTGNAAKAFIEMGISTHQSTEALLQQVSAYLMHAPAAQQARIAQELFGRTGTEMIPLFASWSQGADNLTAKYDALGRIIDPELTKAAKQSTIELNAAWQAMEVASTGPVVHLTQALTGMLNLAQGLPSNATAWQNWGSAIALDIQAVIDPVGAAINLFRKLKAEAPGAQVAPVAKPIPKAKAIGVDEDVADLQTLDPKLDQIKTKLKELGEAKAILAKIPLSDTKDLADARQAVADLQKEYDGLTRAEANPAGRAAMRDRKKALEELVTGAKQLSAELQAEARSDASRDVNLAKAALTEKKTLLEEEFTAHKITAQEKYDATVAALRAEEDAERQALNVELNSNTITAAQAHDLQNKLIEMDASTNAAIAEAHRALTAELAAEDRKRLESWREADSQIESLESGLISDIFTKNQSLTADLEQLGLRLLEQEVQDDAKMLTQRLLVNAGMLASDQATAQGGLIAKLLGLTTETAATTGAQAAQTAAVAAGTTARTSIHVAGAAVENASIFARVGAWIASELGMTSATIGSQAAKTAAVVAGTAAQTAAITAGKIAQSITNVAAAESNAGVAAAGAAAAVAPIPIIGPALAVAAAASTLASLQPYVALAALDVGTNMVPRDMPAMIHAGERIMPKADNAALMKAISGGAPGGDGGGRSRGGRAELNFAPTINYHEPKTLRALLETQSRDMLSFLQQSIRDGSLQLAANP